jgi:hypothetical protein
MNFDSFPYLSSSTMYIYLCSDQDFAVVAMIALLCGVCGGIV